MNCRSCGAPLPQGATACPNCGTFVPAYHVGSGSLPDDPTYHAGSGSLPDDPTFARVPPSGSEGATRTTSKVPPPDAGGPTTTSPRIPPAGEPTTNTPRVPPAGADGPTTTTSRIPPPGAPGMYPGTDPYAAQYRNVVPPPPPPYQQANAAPPVYQLSNTAPHAYQQPGMTQPPVQPTAPKKSARWRGIGVSLLLLIIFSGLGFGIRYVLSGGAIPTVGQNTPVAGQSTSTTAPASSPTAVQALYDQTTSKTPVMNDALTQPDNYGWDNYATANTNCAFVSGIFHSKAQSGYFSPCYAKATNYSNFILQAQISFVSGHSGGLVFRANSQTDEEYQFRVSTDGTYILKKLVKDNAGQLQTQTLYSGSSSVVSTAANAQNLVAVLVQGDNISIFVNKHYLHSVSDTTYQSGQVGVYVDSDAGSVEAIFKNVQVWSL